jgi:hypothetical protein
MPGIVHGATLSAAASITFDDNASLNTPAWLTTIDALPPVSALASLGSVSSSVEIALPWSAMDEGAGVATVDLLVAVDDGAWNVEAYGIREPIITYVGEPGHHYRFLTLARDAAGQVEALDPSLASDVSVAAKARPPRCGNRAVTRRGSGMILGTAGNDVILGSSGNDTIFGLGGKDILCGGSGDDVLFGGDGVDRLLGQGGNDVLHGGGRNDRIDAGSGDDVLYGDDGGDALAGGVGDDVLIGGPGRDKIDGGPDDDMCIVEPLMERRPKSCEAVEAP